MKIITLPEFEAQPKEIAIEVIASGEDVCVNCKEHGKFVIVEEGQYKVLSDALKTVLAAANMDDETYKAVQRAAKQAGIKGSYGRDL